MEPRLTLSTTWSFIKITPTYWRTASLLSMQDFGQWYAGQLAQQVVCPALGTVVVGDVKCAKLVGSRANNKVEMTY